MHSSLNIWRKNDDGPLIFIMLFPVDYIGLIFMMMMLYINSDYPSLLIGFNSCCKEDAQKCSCPFYTWSYVPTIGPISKGTLELRLL